MTWSVFQVVLNFISFDRPVGQRSNIQNFTTILAEQHEESFLPFHLDVGDGA
jgi:hypothetical protein